MSGLKNRNGKWEVQYVTVCLMWDLKLSCLFAALMHLYKMEKHTHGTLMYKDSTKI